MYPLPCPSCSAIQHVSVAKAGDVVICDQCGADVPVPKLGDLKRLAPVETASQGRQGGASEESGKSPMLFVGLGLLAVAALVIAAFCGLRWALITVPMTTEGHIARYAEEYPQVAPAVLIREYESMEKYGLELAGPLGYTKISDQKREWGTNAVVASGVGLVSIVSAFVLGSRRRRPRA